MSSAKVKESLTVKSLDVRGLSKVTKNCAKLYVEVPIADNNGQKGGEPLIHFYGL